MTRREALAALDPFATSNEARTRHTEAVDALAQRLMQDYDFEGVLLSQTDSLLEALSARAEPVLGGGALSAMITDVYEIEANRLARLTFERGEAAFKSRKQVDDAMLFQWSEAVAAVLRESGAEHVTAINETTRRWLRGFLAMSTREGWGPIEAARQMRRAWTDLAKSRAENIARTELLGAMNLGQVLGAESVADRLGLTMQKSWLAFLDDATRDSHRAAHGQTVGLRERFTVGGASMRHPGDASAPVGEIARCRCSVTFEVL